MKRGGELARYRAAMRLSEEDCQIWFGIGLATLERVEAGEVEPDPELEHRIDLFLRTAGCGVGLFPLSRAATPDRSGARLDGPTGGAGQSTTLRSADFSGSAP